MRITRSTLRRLIAEESARLLREAAEEEESAAMDEAERGKKGHGKKHSADCLYVLYGGRGVYYYTAPCGLSEEEAAEKGHDVSADVAGGEDMADPLSLYDWLQRHDEITAVYDDESAGGEVSKDEFMEQLHAVGGEEGLFADDEFINEDDDLEEGAFPEELEGVYGEEPPEFDETDEDPNYFSDEFEDSSEDPNYFDTDYDDESASDDSWMDIETGEDDVPYGAADVALRKGRGHRTDEGRDPLDSGDYEGRREYSDDPDDESGSVDRWGEPIPYLKHDSEATDLDAAAEDEMAGEEEDWSWDGHDYEPDLKRTSRFAHTAQKYKETGNSDPGMDPDDHIFGRPRGLDESDYDDYEHAYAMGGGSDEEGFAIDYDTGRPSPFAAKHLPKPRPAVDDVEGPDQDDVWGDDDMGRKGARDDYEHAWKMGGGRDEDGFAMDYDKLDEARWAKLAGILKG